MTTGTVPARVAVFTLGGTIAMTKGASGGAVPQLSGADLLAAVPGLDSAEAELEVHEFRRLPGASLTYSDLLDLARTIDKLDVDGVVITQGTDTIEETSYLLDLIASGDTSIVMTGAMRNASLAGADGPANILAAVRVAASPASRGLGSVVVFGEEIHAARWVRKTHSSSPTAFTSYPGPIGCVAEDRVLIWSRPPRQPRITVDSAAEDVRTAVIPVGLGDDGAVLDAVGPHVNGLVVAAFGVGHVPGACVDVLARLAARIPVVLASKTGSGPVLRNTYSFPGSEADLIAKGLIPAGTLDPAKARILLNLLLMTGASREDVTRRFLELTTHAAAGASHAQL